MKKIIIVLSAGILAGAVALTGCSKTEKVTAETPAEEAVPVNNIFSGVVAEANTVKIDKDSSYKVKEILVEAGQEVKAGDVLFIYDTEQAAIDLETGNLEIEKMKNSITNLENNKAELETEKARASSDKQLGYSLEIQEIENEILQTRYNITAKEKEVARIQATIENAAVRSEIDGKIKEINENGGYDNNGNEKHFMVISEDNSFSVMGYVNEANIYELSVGTPVTVMSRVDKSTWTGIISSIDLENPSQGGSSMYYYGVSDSMSSSSRYPFYVTLDDPEGLMLGQHVYIDAGLMVQAGYTGAGDADGGGADTPVAAQDQVSYEGEIYHEDGTGRGILHD